MKSRANTLAAPFPYFGGKSLAGKAAWAVMGDPTNYVEPFAGSAAMLLGRPNPGKVETINDADGMVANFWRAVSKDAPEVARHVDWPVNDVDLLARHSWLVRNRQTLLDRLHADPEFYDAKMAGWWCWGLCNWIGSGWCSGEGPWVHDGEKIVDRRLAQHLPSDQGVGKQRPDLSGRGQGVNRQHDCCTRTAFLLEWFGLLMHRLREVRVTCGDWQRVLGDCVTVGNGMTAVFLDPPYTKANMDYAIGGVGGPLADAVRAWCAENGHNPLLRIVLCGHAGEHDELLAHGWTLRSWKAHPSYARSSEARANSASETLWCSPHCVPERVIQEALF